MRSYQEISELALFPRPKQVRNRQNLRLKGQFETTCVFLGRLCENFHEPSKGLYHNMLRQTDALRIRLANCGEEMIIWSTKSSEG